MKLGLIIFLLLFSLSAVGKKLYKFQDENGNWTFTDQPPQTKTEITIKQLDVEPKRRVKLFKSGEENQPDYYFYNEYAGPVEIEAVFFVQENVYSIPELPHRFVIENGKSDVLFKVRAIDKRKPWSFKVKYNFEVGGPMRNYVSTAYYLPPIAPNASFRITQGFGGKISHTEEYNKYAVDISMPVGTPIHAARDGAVMSVDNDFYKHGFDKKYLQDANVIRILHKDGSMAVYAHLELEKAQVYPKDEVKTGQIIGYSGNTGYSDGPHLHFAIQINKGMALTSVPFSFINSEGQTEEPTAGKTITGISN